MVVFSLPPKTDATYFLRCIGGVIYLEGRVFGIRLSGDSYRNVRLSHCFTVRNGRTQDVIRSDGLEITL